MAVSLSVVVLLAIVVFFLLRNGAMRLLPALAVAAFGYSLASTGLAGPLNTCAATLTHLISQINI